MKRALASVPVCAAMAAGATRRTSAIVRRAGQLHRSLSVSAVARHELRMPVTTFSEDELMIRDAAQAFASETIAPLVSEMDDTGVLDQVVIDGLFENGFMGVEIPEEHGGTGANFTSSCLVIEALATIDPAVSAGVDVHNTVVNNTLKMFASEDVQARFLPDLASKHYGSFCLSEAGSGSDAFALKTKAEQSGDEFVLTGEKLWISNAEHAGVFLVFANVDFSKGYRGITCFAVPRDSPGLEVGKPENKLGIRCSSTCTVRLNDVRVPASNVVGEVGTGYKIAIGILNEGRIGIGAQMVGLAQGCFDATMPYLWQREQFGTKIGDFQGMEFQYAEVALEIEAARLLVYNAARMKEAGMPFVKEAAMAKLKASRVAELTASKCIEWLGGVGFTKDYAAEKFFRDSKIGAIYEGTSNIQLATIAKFLKPLYQ